MNDRSLPQIGDIVVGHDGFLGDSVDDLAGLKIDLSFVQTGEAAEVEFISSSELRHTGLGHALSGPTRRYDAFGIDDKLYFVDVKNDDEQEKETVALIIDTGRCRGLEITVQSPSLDAALESPVTRFERTESLSAVKIRYRHGQFGESKSGKLEYQKSDELTGKRVLCTYSDSHVYDHIYVSDSHYLWYCVSGPDQGLGDFDECDYFKIAENIYLVSWRESLLPMGGITVENYRTMRSIGTIFGLDVKTNRTAKVTVAANMELINETSY